jgi:citronellol/citronellal dehydrogenase
MFAPNLLKDKIILVTGGRSGIGYNIAANCLKYGAVVYISSRDQTKLQEAAEKLSDVGDCRFKACDIREVHQVQQLAEFIQQQSGKLDILVNNAGGQFPSPAEDISTNGWNAVINNNLNGTWRVTQTMAKHFFIPQKTGNIINIIANIYRGFPGMVHTGAARAGVDNLSKTLAVEWSKYHININAIAPGVIRSTGLKQYPVDLLKGVSDRIPLKRLGETQEVADLATFLMSPMARYITGETVYIDGGQRLWGDLFEL